VFDVEIEKEIECKEHTDEVVRFYCETCETAICILCTFNDHKDHEVAQFSDAVIKYKSTIEELLHGCQEQLDRFTEQLGVISECESCIRSAEQKIRDVSIDMISDIRTRERILLEEIQNIYGSETMELIKRKDALSTDLDALKSTVNLTEIILKGLLFDLIYFTWKLESVGIFYEDFIEILFIKGSIQSNKTMRQKQIFDGNRVIMYSLSRLRVELSFAQLIEYSGMT